MTVCMCVLNKVGPLNGQVGSNCSVHCSEVVPSSEVLTCIQLLAGGTQFVHCREVVRSSECSLLVYVERCDSTRDSKSGQLYDYYRLAHTHC